MRCSAFSLLLDTVLFALVAAFLLIFFDDLIETFSDSHVRCTSMLFVSFSQTTTVKIPLTNLLKFWVQSHLISCFILQQLSLKSCVSVKQCLLDGWGTFNTTLLSNLSAVVVRVCLMCPAISLLPYWRFPLAQHWCCTKSTACSQSPLWRHSLWKQIYQEISERGTVLTLPQEISSQRQEWLTDLHPNV